MSIAGPDGWNPPPEDVGLPRGPRINLPLRVVARDRGTVKRLYFRGDAAFANPEIYEFLEAEGTGYAIRLPAKQHLAIGVDLSNEPYFRPVA